MSAALSFFEAGLVVGTIGVLFFCGWAFVRTVREDFRRRPFEDHELREFVAHVQAKKAAREARKLGL